MAQTTEKTKAIIEKFKTHETDTGSCEVQIALLTERILYLTEHFKTHAKDHHSRRGLLKLVGQRRNLIKYLQKKNMPKCRWLIRAPGTPKSPAVGGGAAVPPRPPLLDVSARGQRNIIKTQRRR